MTPIRKLLIRWSKLIFVPYPRNGSGMYAEGAGFPTCQNLELFKTL